MKIKNTSSTTTPYLPSRYNTNKWQNHTTKWTFALVLLSLFSLFSPSMALTALGASMLSTVGTLSTMTGQFTHVTTVLHDYISFEVLFPKVNIFPGSAGSIQSGKYIGLDCTIMFNVHHPDKLQKKVMRIKYDEMDKGTYPDTGKVLYRFNVRVPSTSSNVVILNGEFHIFCNYYGPDEPFEGREMTVTAIVGSERATAVTTGNNYEHTGSSYGASAYMPGITHALVQSAYTLANVKSFIVGKEFIIRNPPPSRAKTITPLIFSRRDSLPPSGDPNIYCMVERDRVYSNEVVKARVIENGNGLRITLGRNLNTSNLIEVFCPAILAIADTSVYGEFAKYLPSMVEFSNDNQYYIYAHVYSDFRPVIRVKSPNQQGSDDEFEIDENLVPDENVDYSIHEIHTPDDTRRRYEDEDMVPVIDPNTYTDDENVDNNNLAIPNSNNVNVDNTNVAIESVNTQLSDSSPAELTPFQVADSVHDVDVDVDMDADEDVLNINDDELDGDTVDESASILA